MLHIVNKRIFHGNFKINNYHENETINKEAI